MIKISDLNQTDLNWPTLGGARCYEAVAHPVASFAGVERAFSSFGL